jgi:hypothetical protein
MHLLHHAFQNSNENQLSSGRALPTNQPTKVSDLYVGTVRKGQTLKFVGSKQMVNGMTLHLTK